MGHDPHGGRLAIGLAKEKQSPEKISKCISSSSFRDSLERGGEVIGGGGPDPPDVELGKREKNPRGSPIGGRGVFADRWVTTPVGVV